MKQLLGIAILIGSILLTGCGSSDEPAEPTPTPAPQPTPAAPSAKPAPAPRRTDFASLETGTLTTGPGTPSDEPGLWNQFRGVKRDGIVPADVAGKLPLTWPAEGPTKVWTIDGLAMGYSGPTVAGGRVFFNDYDTETRHWMMRCVSLADGREIWRWSYRRPIRPNHAITRTVPATDGKTVVGFDPKATLHGFDAVTGKRVWAHDIPGEFGARIPPWYNGQCPLIDNGRVILGLGGPKALMAAFDLATGDILWQTPNDARHSLSHSSVMPAELGGRRQYLWCTLKGLVGVDAETGAVLWEAMWTPASEAAAAKVAAYVADKPNASLVDWRPNTAVAPSPVAIDGERVFMTAGYKAGVVMLRVAADPADVFSAKPLFTLAHDEFNCDCHTPILFADHLFGVDHSDKRGKFACLGLDGKVIWRHDGATFGLGNWIIVGDRIFVLDGDTGMLRMLAADPAGYDELARAQVLDGHDVWAPMAYANGKLILRDMGKMVCLEIGPAK